MIKTTKLSESKIPDNFFSVKLEPLSEETQKRLKTAAIQANENIRRNNLIYDSSNANVSNYPISFNSEETKLILKK